MQNNTPDPVIVVDFGAQYAQLIARRVRDLGVYSEVVPYDVDIRLYNGERGPRPLAVILSGGPASVYAEGAPELNPELLELGVPVLGFCYGMQAMSVALGGRVPHTDVGEYGPTRIEVQEQAADEEKHASRSRLFQDTPNEQKVWMSHRDSVGELPRGFVCTASSATTPIAAMEDPKRCLYATQFHPEVVHTQYGKQMLHNFLFDICHLTPNWEINNLAEQMVASLRTQIGGRRVILGLSGGVDSSVVAALLSRAIGDKLTCVFVDHGMLRKDEGAQVAAVFGGMEPPASLTQVRPDGGADAEGGATGGAADDAAAVPAAVAPAAEPAVPAPSDRENVRRFHTDFVYVHAQERYLKLLEGVKDPEQKRHLIGTEFWKVFFDEAAKLEERTGEPIKFLAQGTIYPDTIESGSGTGAANVVASKKAATIKSHHNLIPFPPGVHFDLIEPLRLLFKDEVRRLGTALGLPDYLVWRQPFPGPGLAVRIIGDITAERLDMLREADAIVREEIDAYNEQLAAETGVRDSEHSAWQYFAVLPADLRSVGVMGDERTYQNPIIVRAVESQDAMTADWAKFNGSANRDFDFSHLLSRISTRIVGEVAGINRVLYDVTSKPPGTIEFE
jgi:GMP synthase (glutamine-hydrolysing)